MSERTFFRNHSVSKILTFDPVIEGGQIVAHLIKKITKWYEKPNKTWNISTALIIIKTEVFRFSEKVRLGLRLGLRFNLCFSKTYVDFLDKRSFEEKFREKKFP